ncbi:hypothetical protein BS78_03G201700 [Paspalum vaginatum]|nr:hypothetical protein BS78_03G201700 [Paspalum vaginatum]
MQRDSTVFTGNSFTYGHEVEDCMPNGLLGGHCNQRAPPVSPAIGVPLGMTNPQIRSPLDVLDFQPSKVCPRNLIIFDHTDEKGCIMYHPALVNKLNPTNINVLPCHGEVVCRSSGQDNGNLEQSSTFKEDTEEIDALLSSYEDSDEDDVLSTGRTPDPLESGPSESSSPPRFKKISDFSEKSSVCYGSMENISHEKIRNMVAVLRGIIPGGDQLDTSAILEEAVRYLKFLKMEANKLGLEG